ncbi:MAG: hypothetical protein ACOCU3_00680 [bacterium]
MEKNGNDKIHNSSRRNFCKNTSLLIGGGFLFSSMPVLGFSDSEGKVAEFLATRISGRYPHLTMFNNGGECGIGALVPWADRLWAITYSPHDPRGNDHDGLYEITPDLEIIRREESVGGTPAGRMIHRESEQLFIGPYAIDKERHVRVIPYDIMPGRHTAIARHLTQPGTKVYYFTMEEGMYEVDVNTLEVKTLYLDSNITPGGNDGGPRLPGYHGKGGYSGQGRVVISNNGRIGTGGVGGDGLIDFRLPGGCLASWNGEWGGKLSPKGWQIINDNQFTEVTGPGGIFGNDSKDTPLWSMGWDHRSLILKLLDNGEWSTFRLPKADYSYEGLHGWHVEWPRIRQVGPEGEYLMNHHGMWFDFPGEFSGSYHPAPRPIASHLKITGDFTRWQDQVVFGCDDNALSKFGGGRSLTDQSHSNFWFSGWEGLKDNGRPYGWGGPWVHDDVHKGQTSEPFAFLGYTNRQLHLSNINNHQINFLVEIDKNGRGEWEYLVNLSVPPHGYIHHEFADDIRAEWIRLTPDASGKYVTAYFHFGKGGGVRTDPAMFESLAPADPGTFRSVGLLYTGGQDRGILQFAAWTVDSNGRISEAGYYEMDQDLKLKWVDNPGLHSEVKKKAEIETDEFHVDKASVIMVDYWGNRFRLPKGDPSFDNPTEFGIPRLRRELATERDIFNVHGTIYCLPRANSGDVANMKPVATHNKRFTDFCPWRGLVAIAGCRSDLQEDSEHFRISDDGKAGLWLGDYDDLWKLGKPVGTGGPLKDTDVLASIPSDPYIMTGYDKKKVQISHNSSNPVEFSIEICVIMNIIAVSDEFGIWNPYKTITVQPGEQKEFHFPEGFSAHWVRLKANQDCNASAIFTYT